MTDFEGLLKILNDGGVKYILIGGMAAIAHGAARVTYDLDVVYERSPQNLLRVAETLAPLRPRLRGAPPDISFRWDAETLERGLNFTLSTTLGDIDLIGEAAGGGTYTNLVQHTLSVEIEGMSCLCVNLEQLIDLKKAAGRKKDREAIAELEAIKQELDRSSDS